MARSPVLAAGGIVLRQARPPLIAVVRLRKGEWVLPKGKLDDGETAHAAAMREVLEETGHEVSMHEFLGTLAYEAGGRPKIVHYWRMETSGKPTRELMRDVTAVDWLPLEAAVERLSRDHERAFLANVGPLALETARRSRDRKPAAPDKPRRRRIVTPRPVPVSPAIVAPVPAPRPNDDAGVTGCHAAGVDVIKQGVIEPAAIERRVMGESPPPGDGTTNVAASADVPDIDRAPEMDQSSDAVAPDVVGPDAPIALTDHRAFEDQALRISVMQRVRSWLRRAG
jgi:8-oxo-dGTP diphosphatase